MNDVATPTQTALTLKGNLFTLTVVYLNTTDLSAIANQLKQLVASTPKFFQHAPVVLDCSQLKVSAQTTHGDQLSRIDLAGLQRLFKQFNLILVGMRSHTEALNQQALTHGFALLPPARSKYEESYGYRVKKAQAAQRAAATASDSVENQSGTSSKASAVESATTHSSAATNQSSTDTSTTQARNTSATAPASSTAASTDAPETRNAAAEASDNTSASDNVTATASTGTKIITKPVRSGQQIYARGGDLVVLASVSHGAEILADGNIHVYGTLSGRALAGVQGNADCHIFCKKLDAELVAIAGHYRVKEDISSVPKASLLDIHLADNKLVIDAC